MRLRASGSDAAREGEGRRGRLRLHAEAQPVLLERRGWRGHRGLTQAASSTASTGRYRRTKYVSGGEFAACAGE